MKHLTIVQQFMLVSLVVLVGSMLGVGWWVGQHIRHGVIRQTATTTALYVDSLVAPFFQGLEPPEALQPAQVTSLHQLFQNTSLGQYIVTVKLWDAHGRILYSTNPALLGQTFPPSEARTRAWHGEVVAHISNLQDDENALERQIWPRLLEVYSPVRRRGTSEIVAVAEFYHSVESLEQEVTAAQWQSWFGVAGATLLVYLLLLGIVRRGHETIVRQQGALRDTVTQLTTLLAQNEALHERVRRAATRTTALNERFLRRISAELHDGPAQALSLALLRLDSVIGEREAGRSVGDDSGQRQAELQRLQQVLRQALNEMRTLAAGLRLPELDHLALADTLARVVRLHEQRTHTQVTLTCDDLPRQVPLAVKITLYRVIQEALHNAFRHGHGCGQQVDVRHKDGMLTIHISDQGPGFALAQVDGQNGHLGLIGMRERVESLGGRFQVKTAPDHGTTVIAQIPLAVEEGEGHA
jgi:signal transduction histidine kinase